MGLWNIFEIIYISHCKSNEIHEKNISFSCKKGIAVIEVIAEWENNPLVITQPDVTLNYYRLFCNNGALTSTAFKKSLVFGA